jgi:DNA repair protein RecN (Recombination protein N)
MPEELPAVYQAMLEEQRLLDDSAGSLESLSQQVVEHHQLALETARQLHALRQASADELTQLITESMHSLSMPHGVFAIEVALMNAISPPTAPTILSSASPPTPVSRCSRSPKWPPAANCRVLRWRFR